MKIKALVLFLAIAFVACKNDKSNSSSNDQGPLTTETLINMPTGDISIDNDKSSIYWKGYKLLGNHTGKIDLEKGNIVFDNGSITGGNFVVNMNTVEVTELMQDDDDEEEEEDESPEDDKSDLAQHLMASDFFDAAQFPTASFKINKTERNGRNFKVYGDMTIKGHTQPIIFDAKMTDANTLKSTISIDRTKFGIKYGSGSFFSNLGENVIKDKFDLIVSLKLNN